MSPEPSRMSSIISNTVIADGLALYEHLSSDGQYVGHIGNKPSTIQYDVATEADFARKLKDAVINYGKTPLAKDLITNAVVPEIHFAITDYRERTEAYPRELSIGSISCSQKAAF